MAPDPTERAREVRDGSTDVRADARAERAALNAEIIISPWLQDTDNGAEYREFRDSLMTDHVEPAIEDMNDMTDTFFEGFGEGEPNSLENTNVDYRRFHENVRIENKELAERLRDDLLKKFKLDTAQVSETSWTEEAEFTKKLSKVYETTQSTLERIFLAYANRSRPTELTPTLNYDEMLLLRKELPQFYRSITPERMEFFGRMEDVGEETVENPDELKALVLEVLREKSPQEGVLKEMVLKDRVARMSPQEKKQLIQKVMEESDGVDLIDQLIQRQIVTPLDVQRTLAASPGDTRYQAVQEKIADGTYRKAYEKKDEEAAQALEALKKTPGGERLIDLFAFTPAKGATLVLGTLYGAVGLFLNTLINWDLIEAGKFGDFFKNEAFWINAGVLAGSLEYGTSKGRFGTGMLSRFLAKPRGQAVTDHIGEEKIALFMEQYQRMPGIGSYLRDHFDDIHPYLNGLETGLEEKKTELQTMEDEDIDTSDPEMEQLRKQQIENKKREVSKTVFDLIKEDLSQGTAPQVVTQIGEYDGFNREETAVKIAEMYFLAVKFTAPSHDAIETKDNFVELLKDMGLEQ